MPFIRFEPAGTIGVNKDLSAFELPNHAWTDANNVRFLDGYAYPCGGYGEFYGDPLCVPYHLLPAAVEAAQIFFSTSSITLTPGLRHVTCTGHSPVILQQGPKVTKPARLGIQGKVPTVIQSSILETPTLHRYWLYAGLNQICAANVINGLAVHADLTRADITGAIPYAAKANSWTSTLLGGIPIFNAGNVVDPPQYWGLDFTSRCANLPNWPSGLYCRSMRAFRNYLVALGLTKDGVSKPYTLRWSHPADPGTVPASWDIADPTRDCGETDLAEGYDQIVDGLQLRSSFMIYKESSTWRMDFTGGAFVFNFVKVLGTSGAMARNCVVELDGYHAVFGASDIYIHDGQTAQSVLDKQTRRWLYSSLSGDNSALCFAFKNPHFNEVFFCFPSPGATACDKAIVGNYKDRTVAIRDIPSLTHAAFGPIEAAATGIWSTDNDSWDSDASVWDGPDFVPSSSRVLMGSANQKTYLLDTGTSFGETTQTSYLERRGLSFGEPEAVKCVRGIRPRISGDVGSTIKVQLGHADDPYAEPTWGRVMTHTIGTTVADHDFVSGRYIAVRFDTGTAFNWRLDSLDLDVEGGGMW